MAVGRAAGTSAGAEFVPLGRARTTAAGRILKIGGARGATVGQIGPGFLSLPYRPPKPRSDGLTHVLDKGLSLFALESLIQTAGEAIDIVKLGWGTSYVSDGVKAKDRKSVV